MEKAFVKRVGKIYHVIWAGKSQATLTNRQNAVDYCESFNRRLGLIEDENE